MKKFVRILLNAVLGLVFLVAVLAILTWQTTDHPADEQTESVSCKPNTPMLKPKQDVKVMSWNIQYLAGKGYVFYYDTPEGDGPDTRPSPSAVAQTLKGVIQVIQSENPDVLLLQEVDVHSKRTDQMDQLRALQDALKFNCETGAYYWKAEFVPHPKILGSVGMKLVTLSKYQMASATRYQLPVIDADPVTKAFYFRRAILEANLSVSGSKPLRVLNTHLDAFAQGTQTMQHQVEKVHQILSLDTRFIIGGDFNLLPNKAAWDALDNVQRSYFNPETEISILLKDFSSIPSLHEIQKSPKTWYTHFPNDPRVKGPDRTLDYLFYGRAVRLGAHQVRSADTLKWSDHLPLVATFSVE
ncbi:MAG: endonuclease/exonuclease/phosphatase family protein [Deinococcaceae bacterium]